MSERSTELARRCPEEAPPQRRLEGSNPRVETDASTGAVSEDRPAPAWAGDVHAGVEAWTRSPRLSKSGSAEPDEPDEPFQRVSTRRSARRSSRSHDRASSRSTDRNERRTPRPPDTVAQGPDADPEAVARKILLDALTGQARSRKELADKLAKKDVPSELASSLRERA